MTERGGVQIGFFQNFKSADTLLVDSDAAGFELLADTFSALAARGGSVAVHDLPFVHAHGVRLFAVCTASNPGASIEAQDITWRQPPDGWRDTAVKLAALTTEGGGHQYLESGHDQVQLLASSGEYGDVWWATHS